MKYLNPRVHGYIDYIAILFLFVAPSVIGFSGMPATLFYVIGIAYLAMVLLTAYPLGLVKLIPFPVHGIVEIVAAIGLVLLPWVTGFADNSAARNTYLFVGIVLFLVWLTTDYKAAVQRAETRAHI
jgi:hypothetical protein